MRALPTLNGLIGAITVIVWALLLTGTKIHTAKDNTIDELHRDVPSASRPQPRKALSKLAEATPARSAPAPRDGDASIAPHQVAPVFRAAPKPEAYADTGALAEAPQSTGTLRELRPPDERGSVERGPVTSSPGDVASAVPSTPLSPSPGSEDQGTASRAPALQAEAAANVPSVLDSSGALAEPPGTFAGNSRPLGRKPYRLRSLRRHRRSHRPRRPCRRGSSLWKTTLRLDLTPLRMRFWCCHHRCSRRAVRNLPAKLRPMRRSRRRTRWTRRRRRIPSRSGRSRLPPAKR